MLSWIKFSIVLLLVMGCEKFEPRKVDSRPSDDNEGVNGYLTEIKQDVSAFNPFSVDIDSTVVSGPAGSFNVDSTVRVRTWPSVPAGAPVDIGDPEGDIVTIESFVQGTEDLIGSESLLANLTIEQTLAEADSERSFAVVVITDPGTEFEETQLLPSSEIETSGGLALEGSTKTIFQLKTTNAIFWMIPFDASNPPDIVISSGTVSSQGASSSVKKTYGPPIKQIFVEKLGKDLYYAKGNGSDWNDLEKVFTDSDELGSDYNNSLKFYLDNNNSPHLYRETSQNLHNFRSRHFYLEGTWELEYFGPPSGTGLNGVNLNIVQDRNSKPRMMTYATDNYSNLNFWEFFWDDDAQEYIKASLPALAFSSTAGGLVHPNFNRENSFGINPLTGIRYFIYGAGGSKQIHLAKSGIDSWPQKAADSNLQKIINNSCKHSLYFSEMKFDSKGIVHFLYTCDDVNDKIRLYHVSDQSGELKDTFVSYLTYKANLLHRLAQTTRLAIDPFDNIYIAYLGNIEETPPSPLNQNAFKSESIELISKYGTNEEEKISITEGLNNNFIWIRILDMDIDYQGFVHFAYTKDAVFETSPDNYSFNSSIVSLENRSGKFVETELVPPEASTSAMTKLIGIRIESQEPE